jgi:hypothetical protein
MRLAQSLIALGLAAASLALAPAARAAVIYPGWTLVGDYNKTFDPGFVSVAGSFNFPLGGGTSSITLNYDSKANVSGGGESGNFTIFSLAGGFTVDPVTHDQHVHLADAVKKPMFTFDGTVSADGNSIVGTYVKHAGYLDYPGEESGPLTFQRTGYVADTTFRLAFATRMDVKGRVRGKFSQDGRTETKATLAIYGARSFTDGKIQGKVKTDATGYTTGNVKILGKGWKVLMTGPIDVDGFHASCDITAAGFVVKGAKLVFSVLAGPTPPPGPPPPPPKNLLVNATATVVNGQVTITHTDVPAKFFGATAGLTITFPIADGLSTVVADSTDASTTPFRRCIVTVGGTVYGTAAAPAGGGVTLQIRKLTSVRDGQIEVLATGKVYPVGGRPKTVNVLVQALVQ